MKKRLKKIFIIDDDLIYTKLLSRLLKIRDICENVVVFRNGKEALDYFTYNVTSEEFLFPELILVDLNMPIMSGWEFLEEFSKIKSNFMKLPPFYIVSSSINPNDIAKAEKIDFVCSYISKPISMEVFERIRNLGSSIASHGSGTASEQYAY